ncbi:MAG: hypothetical protein AAF337_09700 [Pseudomonadota bacterium]
MVDQRAFTCCAILGGASFLMVMVLLVVYPMQIPSAETAFLPPALALQFATTAEQIASIFGPPGTAQRANIVQSMSNGNTADYVFMGLYALFLAAFFHGQVLKTELRAWWSVLPMIVVVLVFDILENQVLDRIIAAPNSALIGRHIGALQLFTWGKWSTLAVVSAVAAMAFIARGSFVLGALCLPPLLLVLPAYKSPGTSAVYLVLAVGLSWIVMLAHAIKRSILKGTPPALVHDRV